MIRRLATFLLYSAMVPVTISAQAPTPREHYTQAQFDQLFHQVSNWGRWGKDDQLGTINLITSDVRRRAATQVRSQIEARTAEASHNNSVRLALLR